MRAMARPRRQVAIGLLLVGAAACGSVRPTTTAPNAEATFPPGAVTSAAGSAPTAVAGGGSAAESTSHLWMNTRVVPTDGGPVAFAVVVPAGGGPAMTSGGVEGALDRLDGSTWKAVGRFGASLDFWGGFGTVVGPDDELAVPAIGLAVPVQGAGPLEFVTLPELEPGRYRLRSGEVTGEFDVRSGAPTLPPLKGQGRDGLGLLTVSPALMPTSGGPITITAVYGSSGDELSAFARDLSAGADVEQWSGTGWTPQATYPGLPAPITDSASVAITLPRLAEGMYRVVRHHPRGDLTREFWVTSDLDAIAANTPTYTVPGWTLVSTANGSRFSRADGATIAVEVTELAPPDAGWQAGSSMEVQSRPTVRGRPAALVAIPDDRPDSRLIVLSDTAKRLVIRATANVTDAELIAAVEGLEPFPLTGEATVPDIAGRLVGSVAQLAGQEGAATLTGWLVVAADGSYRLCETVERTPKLRCTGPSLEVDATFTHWDPPPLTPVGDGRVSVEPITVAGSLKGEILYIGVL